MTADEFIRLYRSTPRKYQRLGQVAFDELMYYKPALANKISGSIVDPFYDDANLPDFEQYIRENWEKGGQY